MRYIWCYSITFRYFWRPLKWEIKVDCSLVQVFIYDNVILELPVFHFNANFLVSFRKPCFEKCDRQSFRIVLKLALNISTFNVGCTFITRPMSYVGSAIEETSKAKGSSLQHLSCPVRFVFESVFGGFTRFQPEWISTTTDRGTPLSPKMLEKLSQVAVISRLQLDVYVSSIISRVRYRLVGFLHLKIISSQIIFDLFKATVTSLITACWNAIFPDVYVQYNVFRFRRKFLLRALSSTIRHANTYTQFDKREFKTFSNKVQYTWAITTFVLFVSV